MADRNLSSIFRFYSGHPDFDGIRIVDVNQKGIMDDRLIHIAVRRNNTEHVILLLDAGADVNAVGDMGYTPLHYAVWASIEMINLLLCKGADTSKKNDAGMTALDLAKLRGNRLAINLLQPQNE